MIKIEFRLAALLVLLAASMANAVFASNLQLAQAESAAGENQKKSKLVDLWRPGDPGQRMNIRGRITSLDGTPVAGASIHIRQANGEGDYTERYSTTLTSDSRGLYQYGSAVPGQYYGTKHVHVWVTHDTYQSLDTEIYFKGDPNLEDPQAPNAIFLEEASVKGETILYGRFDIVLTPR